MLIYNCTRAFARFIEPHVAKGLPSLVQPPPGESIGDDVIQLRLKQGATLVMQWQCHVIEEQGKSCVIAMESHTRFAMVFTTLQRGDREAFVTAMIERLFNLQWSFARKLQLVSDGEHRAWVSNFLSAHSKVCFFARTDKSVQNHIGEVAHDFSLAFETGDGGMPDSQEECADFDKLFNRHLRGTRDRQDYFCPDEEMLVYWLATYGGWTAEGLARLREDMNQRYRQDYLYTPATTIDLRELAKT